MIRSPAVVPGNRRPLSFSVHGLAALTLVAVACVLSVARAQAVDPTVQVRYDAALGHFLTGPEGMTLYVFGRDEDGVSNCYDACATAWPPLLADQVAINPLSVPGSFSLIERTDGGMQVAYEGRPLYYWASDASPGDTTGQGVNDVWWVANLAPVVRFAETDAGTVLVGPTGMTLYTFDPDGENMSNCTGGCAFNWPPLVGGYDPDNGYVPMAGEGVEGTLAVFARPDGGMQVTLDGRPLYYWIRDAVPGDATGDGVNDVWHVVPR